MRYDFFMVWGNAISDFEEICSMIRSDGGFDILRIAKFEINDMPAFVQEIYACDSVPMQHLIGKTRYLMQTRPEVGFVLVKNKAPDEKLYGEGEFRHIQCAKIKKIKEEIRNRFNPKFSDPNKMVPPLNKGVSHQHCLHASDYESQVDHVLGFLQLNNIAWYNRFDDEPYNITWHINTSSGNYQVVKKNLSNLYTHLILDDGNTVKKRIDDTPHYFYVKGEKMAYNSYIQDKIGHFLQEDHYPAKFDLLIEKFDINYKSEGKSSPIVVNSDGRILDGLHRAVIMKSMGVEEVECIQI